CILEHSNRICLITLAPNHPILKQKKTVEFVDFKINDNVDRATNKVSGRLKRGAQWLNTTAVLCNLKCSDGSVYSVVPGLKANLIEVNELLITNPNLVAEQPFSSGYIAILLTKIEDHSKEMKKLTTEQEFWLKVNGDLNKNTMDND
ncbi:hypothetical protein HELRODRAFT_64826, partial [Helobdella robusta]|uniref:Protein Abitram n=1 Tax=Helobdella robusta TaxID=6412 RepID=T1FXZ9_HELRO